MSLFNKRERVNTRIELSKYVGNHYLNCGLRRVYSTHWAKKWQTYEQDHGAIDKNGSYLTCYRPRVNGKQLRYYMDMSQAHMDLQDIGTSYYNPTNTKYMNKHYINGKSLNELANMPTNDFLRHIESLPCRGRQTPHRRKK